MLCYNYNEDWISILQLKSKTRNLKEAASNLYITMRKIKENGFKRIFVAKIPKQGPGIAINDRLKRASFNE